MAWIESHQEIWRHPKTKKLARLLGVSVPTAVGHLHGIWYWALDFAQDGDLRQYDPEEIADAALWEGDPRQFVEALVTAGYGVKWEEGHKHITYTTPENMRCRDSKLFDQTLLRENMEHYFAMGGREYLESRREWREFGEPEPTLDDAVCGLASIFEALETGDNDRFHLETLHHSEDEIELILRRGGKIDRTIQYEVDDEDEEYEQYHGFSMSM